MNKFVDLNLGPARFVPYSINKGKFFPQGRYEDARKSFCLSQLGKEEPLASSGEKPGMLLNIQQCTGATP